MLAKEGGQGGILLGALRESRVTNEQDDKKEEREREKDEIDKDKKKERKERKKIEDVVSLQFVDG